MNEQNETNGPGEYTAEQGSEREFCQKILDGLVYSEDLKKYGILYIDMDPEGERYHYLVDNVVATIPAPEAIESGKSLVSLIVWDDWNKAKEAAAIRVLEAATKIGLNQGNV
ncbi:hypothetical protein HN997_02115, partial [archaeon]|nr:hypothetical protein [archaeon]